MKGRLTLLTETMMRSNKLIYKRHPILLKIYHLFKYFNLFRSSLSTAFNHFKNCLISDLNINSNVHDLFINVELLYAKKLEDSINYLKSKKILKPRRKKFYNYIIVNAKSLYDLLERFVTDDDGLKPREITIQDLIAFKAAIIYIGKGCCNRKLKHMEEAVQVFDGTMNFSKITAKLSKISKSWENGNGVAIIQLFSDSDHYISLCRENSMIKAACTVNNLTNLINGSIYGLMKNKWTAFEIKNFGEMLLYFALKQSILERPSILYPADFRKKKTVKVFEPKKYFIQTNYELNGILEYFLEL